MPATVYAVAGGKGGVGKTTTAANLAATLRATGREVVLVDADLAMSNLQGIVGIDHDPTIHDVLAGNADLEDAVVGESSDALDAAGRLDVLPGASELDAFAAADPSAITEVVDVLADRYDAIVLDTASGVSRESAIPIEAADETIVMTTPDQAAVFDAKKTAEFARGLDCSVAGIVVSRTCQGLSDEEIVETVGADHLATVPDLDMPGVDPLLPYRTLVVRLLIGHDVATDPSAVLDIEPGQTPRITKTLKPTPETSAASVEVSAPVSSGGSRDEAAGTTATDGNGGTVAAEELTDETEDEEKGSRLGRFVDALGR
ncbi:MinD/ParA family ATP-binding protein [Halorientalis sp.]|uniref:MinD/ParA family ATP-binding protein n=1 Tax=Halorientalis sp. TaxID=1931229 RepID=UPI002617FAD8|nr:MinD/ParA family protein [Halorientalis sp.]